MNLNKILYYGNYTFFVLNLIMTALQIHSGMIKGAGVSLFIASLNLFAVLTYKER